jgi:hypothetical protein
LVWIGKRLWTSVANHGDQKSNPELLSGSAVLRSSPFK